MFSFWILSLAKSFLAISSLLPVIGNFAHNYASSVEEIRKAKATNQRFAALIDEGQKMLAKVEGIALREIETLLILPMQV